MELVGCSTAVGGGRGCGLGVQVGAVSLVVWYKLVYFLYLIVVCLLVQTSWQDRPVDEGRVYRILHGQTLARENINKLTAGTDRRRKVENIMIVLC